MDLDTTNWSGEGEFTQVLIEYLGSIPGVALLRVEDAPTSRSEADYNFISNELFVGFTTETQEESVRRWGILPSTRTLTVKRLTMAGLEAALTAVAPVGSPDYSDEGMLQYLRSERIIPAYQTRGYKLVELVRIYEAGTEPRRE